MVVSRRFIVHTAGPHTALIKSSGKKDVSIVIGGTLYSIPITERVDKLSLTLRTLSVDTENGVTVNGVAVSVQSAVQVKIQGWANISSAVGTSSSSESEHDGIENDGDTAKPHPRGDIDDAAVRLAAQHFLGKSDEDINETIRQTVAGHQRAIIGMLTVKQLYSDRVEFCKRVREVAKDDLRNMGLTLVSYTVANISDTEGYIEALGVRQTELAQRNAREGAALHQAKARMYVAEASADAHVISNAQEELRIASDLSTRMLRAETRAALFRQAAVADKAHEIANAGEEQTLAVRLQEASAAQVEAGLAVGRAQVHREVLRKERLVNVEADAELYRSEMEAHSSLEEAAAEADRVRLVAEAEAEASRLRGLAEAEVLLESNKAWQESLNGGVVLERIIDTLPELAREIVKPLTNTENMVFVSEPDCEPEVMVEERRRLLAHSGGKKGDDWSDDTDDETETTTTEDTDELTYSEKKSEPSVDEEVDVVEEMTRLIAEVPETVGAISGFDVVEFLGNLLSKSSSAPPSQAHPIVLGVTEGVATGLVELLHGE